MTVKKLSKIILCLVLSVCTLLSVAVYVSAAEPISETLVELEQAQDISIAVFFDVEFPQVKLTRPNGKTITVKEGTTEVGLIVEDGWALIQINSAAKGEWKIDIQPGKNTEISYNLMGTMENIWIQYVKTKMLDNGKMEVTFLSEIGNEETGYNYELYLTTNEAGAGEALIDSGGATTGEEKVITVDLTDYNSYSSYVLNLLVYKNKDGVELFDEYESDPFSYTNPITLQAPDGVDVKVDVEERMLHVNFANYKNYRYSGYFITLTKPGEATPFYFIDYTEDEDQLIHYIEEAYTEFNVNFYGRDGKLLSEPVTRLVKLGDKGYLDLVTESPTSQSMAQIKTNTPKDTELTVKVGEEETKFTSDGSEDVVAVTIANGPNALYAETAVDNVVYFVDTEIYKDGNPPVITFYEPYNGMNFTNQSVKLLGNVTDAVKLRFGENDVALDENGEFTLDVTLVPGENVIELVAEDKVGNTTSRTIYLYGDETITAQGKIASFTTTYLPLIIAGAVSIAAIIFAVVLAVRREKLKKFSFASVVVLLSVICAGAAGGLVYNVLRWLSLKKTANSMELSNLVDADVNKAAQIVAELEACPTNTMIWAGITAGAVIVLVLMIVIRNAVKKRREMKNILA